MSKVRLILKRRGDVFDVCIANEKGGIVITPICPIHNIVVFDVDDLIKHVEEKTTHKTGTDFDPVKALNPHAPRRPFFKWVPEIGFKTVQGE